MEMTWEEWINKYIPIWNACPNKETDVHNIWTTVDDGDSGREFMMSGIHCVNGLAVYVTENPWGVEEGDDCIEITPDADTVLLMRASRGDYDIGQEPSD